MMSFVLLVLTGAIALLVVGTPMLLIHLTAEWWYRDGPGKRKPYVLAPWPEMTHRKCMGCGAQYHVDWDPPDFTPRKARRDPSWMSGGLCPNCSGAD